MPPATNRERTLKLARRARGVTPRELADQGIHRQVLTRLVADGQIERVARGVYRLPERTRVYRVTPVYRSPFRPCPRTAPPAH